MGLTDKPALGEPPAATGCPSGMPCAGGHRVFHRLGIPERHALGRTVGEVRNTVLAQEAQRQTERERNNG